VNKDIIYYVGVGSFFTTTASLFTWLFFSDCLTLKVKKALHTFEMPGSTCPVTWCHVLEQL